MLKKTAIIILLCLPIILSASVKELFKEENSVETMKNIELTKSPIPIDPAKKYQISFSARTNSEYTLEKNERIRIMDLRRIASRLRLEFYDEKGGKFPYNYIDIFVLTNNYHRYVRVFYPPTKAKTSKIFLQPAKNSGITVKKVSVITDLEGKENECLNLHPTFDYGDLNTYGCRLGYGGRFYARPDGKTVWKTGFLGYTPAFPLKENTFYDFYCIGKKYKGRKSYMLLDCYNGKDKRPFKSMRVNLNEKGEITKLKMPSGTVYGILRCYCVILEEFKVTESKKNM